MGPGKATIGMPAASSHPVSRRTWMMFGLAILAGAAVSAGLRMLPDKGQKLTLTPVVAKVLNDRDAPSAGPGRAEVTIVVYTDYQCAVCKRTDGALERIVAADPGVRVIYKDWPILGEASVAAARAALAADRQGKYLAVHRGLMASRAPLDEAQIRRVAIAAGADWPRLTADRTAHARTIEAQLGRHGMEAWSLGIPGSPGYLVGPYLIKGGLDDRDLARAVARARRAGPPR